MTTSPTAIEPVTGTVLAAEDVPESAACRVTEDVGPPAGLTDNRADLVTWWRWRYSTLESDSARSFTLLVQALGEAQGYRQALQAALGVLHEQAGQLDRLRNQNNRLRDEYRRFRERVMAVTT